MKFSASFTFDTAVGTKTTHSVECSPAELIQKMIAVHGEEATAKFLYNGYSIAYINSGARKMETSEQADGFISEETAKLGGSVTLNVPKKSKTEVSPDEYAEFQAWKKAQAGN